MQQAVATGQRPPDAIREPVSATAPGRLVPLALVALAFLAYFRRWKGFGLYGDDFDYFGGAINRSWPAEFGNTWYCLTHWPQGRPLGIGLNLGLIPHAVFAVGGLAGLHLVAFLLFSLNAVLLQRVVARAHPPAVAFAAGAFLAVAPADTVKLSLTFAYNFQIAIAVGLLAIFAALSRRPILFAVALAATLTMVEPMAMIALVVPPAMSRSAGWVRRTTRHTALWSAVLLLVMVARRLIGDPWGTERVGEITGAPLLTAHRALESATTGIWTHRSLVIERLRLALHSVRLGDFQVLAVIAACTLLALAFLAGLAAERRAEVPAFQPRRGGKLSAGILIATGLLSMFVTYASYFRLPWYPASARSGFVSGVHVIAAVGAALTFSGLVALAWAFARRLRWVVAIGAALCLGLLGGFGEMVQREYVTTWRFQKEFWQAYRRLCGDAGDGTFVLILDRGLPQNRFIDLFSWGTEILPDELFVYRAAPVATAPVVLLAEADPATRIAFTGAQFHWKPSYYFMLPKGPEQQPRNLNVILLERSDRGWSRIEGDVKVDGGTLSLRPAIGDILDRVPTNPLARVFDIK
jgi:hypothetical protein